LGALLSLCGSGLLIRSRGVCAAAQPA
jgi:hypothetical protein